MIRFASFLSPVLYDTYQHIAEYVGERLSIPTVLTVEQSPDALTEGRVDIAFLCGLLYVHMTSQSTCPVEVLAAPVLQGARYQGRPIYYSDVIVRRDSPYASLDDLQGCTWAYNEEASHSGYNLVCYSLLERGKTLSHFGRLLKTGSHGASLQAVLDGKADATAIDSHVLDVLFSQRETLSQQLCVIDMLGPSTIPPIVVSKRMDVTVKREIQQVLCTMHQDPHATCWLREGLIDRFVPITDEQYDDVRAMFARVQGIGGNV